MFKCYSASYLLLNSWTLSWHKTCCAAPIASPMSTPSRSFNQTKGGAPADAPLYKSPKPLPAVIHSPDQGRLTLRVANILPRGLPIELRAYARKDCPTIGVQTSKLAKQYCIHIILECFRKYNYQI